MLRAASAAAAAANAAAGGSRQNTPRPVRRRSSAATDATTAARAAAPRAEAVAYFALESALALSVALAINSCLIVAVAAGLDKRGGGSGGGGGGEGWRSLPFSGPTPPTPPTPPPPPPSTRTLGLADAGAFLASRYGPAAAVVWGVGLLAAGQSSTM